MKARHTLLIAMVLTLTLLTACVVPAVTPATDTGDGTPATPTTVAEESEAAAVGTSCEAGFRPFVHFAGETCVPENPQRIVTLTDQNALLPLLELGVKPVGSAGRLRNDGSGIFRRTDGFDTTGIEFLGDFTEPNLEGIAAMQPDLIVGYEFQVDQYEMFSQIAPTVLIQIFDRPLDEVLMEFALLADAQELGETLHEAYQAQIDRINEGLGDRRTSLSVVILNPVSATEFYRVYNTGQAIGTVMGALGVAGMALPEDEGSTDGPLSIEVISEHLGDVILVLDYSGEQTDPVVDEFLASPILNSQPTAQAGQVYRIDGSRTVGSAWVRMQTFLDAIEDFLLDPALDVDVIQE